MYKLIPLLLLLSGCASNMQLMARDGGKVYQGNISSNGFGGGTLSVNIDGRTCAGRFVQTSSGDTFGFYTTYGAGLPKTSFLQTLSGSGTYKSLLTCSDGTGLRCDAQGTTTGGGICEDSNKRVFDMIYS